MPKKENLLREKTPSRKLDKTLVVAAALLMVALLSVPGVWAADKYKTLYTFTGGKDGSLPSSGLIFDAAGHLYGTAALGGSSRNCQKGCGTVFQLTPGANGKWTGTILHTFNSTDGAAPSAGLAVDAAGNLYGTTVFGGRHNLGAVFELEPAANGKWSEKVLHSCASNSNDGYYPYASLVIDAAGNLYGTTEAGGDHGFGTVFRLEPSANGKWTRTVLHALHGGAPDGADPRASVIFDAAGNVYTTASHGSTYDGGNAFELIPGPKGTWADKVLHIFNNTASPWGNLVFDAAGNLYGTTAGGGGTGCGGDGCGTVFELMPGANGDWTETILHSFKGEDGEFPVSGLVFDGAGNLYGTTYYGGTGGCDLFGTLGCGTVFELTPGANGSWTETIVHSFSGNGTDGTYPFAGLTFDSSGNLYGTASEGGSSDAGTVFEITP